MSTAKGPESVWIRPARPRRDQPTLSRDQIVDAALALLDTDGLEGLSMRRLGARLNAGATSIYWHVANKDELLELALDRIIAEVTAPDPGVAGWREAAAGYARSLRAMIIRHPWAITLFGGRPMLGPNAVRSLDRILGIFEHAGFKDFDLEYAQAMLIDYVIGAAGSEAGWISNQTTAGVTAEDWMSSLRPYLTQLAKEHPRLTSHVENVWSRSEERVLDERFSFGLGCVLDGIAARLPS